MNKTKEIESKLEQQAHSLADFSILNRDRSEDMFVFSDMANHTRASFDNVLVSDLLAGTTIAPTGDLTGASEGRDVSVGLHGVDAFFGCSHPFLVLRLRGEAFHFEISGDCVSIFFGELTGLTTGAGKLLLVLSDRILRLGI